VADQTAAAAKAAKQERVRESMRAVLTDVASRNATITYADLALAVFGPGVPARSPALMRVLGRVCDDEDARTGVRLAAVVVRADTGMPGEGYFTWAASLGSDVSDRAVAWRADVEAVWRSYGGPS